MAKVTKKSSGPSKRVKPKTLAGTKKVAAGASVIPWKGARCVPTGKATASKTAKKKAAQKRTAKKKAAKGK